MAIGWIATLADADSYFKNEKTESSFWDDVPDDVKEPVLMAAYNRIRFDPRFSVPTFASATAEQLDRLSRAQSELANYLLIHQRDEDRRKGLQAQGVTDAGIVKESYDPARLDALPIPALVLAILDPFLKKRVFAGADFDRDEDKTIEGH